MEGAQIIKRETNERGRGAGRVESGGEAPIKGDCQRQARVIQAGERIQDNGQSQELNQGCPSQWIRSGRAADPYWTLMAT